ncbi:YqiA/YcfP family alpha/beta fold hydrolase [Leeia oryzae]|uniref:YqiA/YcfP family alpha/beta fold hydrolase n=1 Tax=Leeia oryzae TaxID=356662 RepID=UPI00036E7D1F|nr:YqiA/YcfP family alpha/beta fold hydrolase [Leeia oryzae]
MLIYLHGFQSSPRSIKAWQLGEFWRARGRDDFLVPALPDRSMDAADCLMALLERQREPVCLIGSSLGGFYAHWLAERYQLPAILVNPAVEAPALLRQMLGVQTNPYTGAEYQLTELDLAVWQAMDVPVTNPDRYWLMTQTGDEVLDYRAGVRKFNGARLTREEGGSHRFEGFETWFDEIMAFADQQAVCVQTPV